MRNFKIACIILVFMFMSIVLSNVLPIKEIYSVKEGETVTATGVVLVTSNSLISKTTWIQDSTAGIMIYGNLPELKLGDVIKVTGKTKLYYGILEILPDKIEIIGQEEVRSVSLNELFDKASKSTNLTSQKIKDLLNSCMSMLVSIEGTVSDIQSYQFTVKTDHFSILVYIRKEANMSIKSLKVGDKVLVTGIMYLYKDTFEILPRNQKDLIVR